jgi:hypothetical protein
MVQETERYGRVCDETLKMVGRVCEGVGRHWDLETEARLMQEMARQGFLGQQPAEILEQVGRAFRFLFKRAGL